VSFENSKAQQICITVCKVPYGKVASYGFIADLAGLPGRARMVGRAMQSAPPELVIPWYRILRRNGVIAFSVGSKQAEKQIGLLQEEGVVVLNHRVNMKQFGWQPDLGELMQMDY
jgi:methylated-DNA-protein-cysteine methyltransferase-like protein